MSILLNKFFVRFDHRRHKIEKTGQVVEILDANEAVCYQFDISEPDKRALSTCILFDRWSSDEIFYFDTLEQLQTFCGKLKQVGDFMNEAKKKSKNFLLADVLTDIPAIS